MYRSLVAIESRTYPLGATGHHSRRMRELVTAADREAARLRDRLAEIEVEQATLEAELAAFNSDYMGVVMTVLLDVQELEARILAIMAARSGASDDAHAAQSARARVNGTTAHIRAVPKPPGPLPTGDIKRLFRDAAKRMHPDLAGGDEARGHAEAFMKRLNTAYRAGDAEAIVNLLGQWEASPFGAGRADGATRSARRVGALGDAVNRAEHRLEELRSSELAQLLDRAMAAAAAGGDLLADMRRDAEAALVRARARLAELQGSTAGR
jgi:hypothetical protein